ncbi:hypothetical protein A0J47_004045 [Photobacterium damselae subsp. damselae]|uniref:hypothetical protein n=1 Tax=Photobacterium damselae TaxID=38293 RepID=UPI000839EA4D|nr:hypothetical protein [Photobacterium damselae]KAB1181539.1 hypothetical protein F6477_04875 [Photobacterium damselae subsp. damselae]MBF7100919.1 hypothetical protein [Photobacterium damselae]QSH57740.1 hypothetical protein A0J47_004045 [Photobacterium damselae subsp. damselae]
MSHHCNHCDFQTEQLLPQDYVITPQGKRVTTQSVTSTFSSLYHINDQQLHQALNHQTPEATIIQQMLNQLTGQLHPHHCHQCARPFSLDLQRDKHACPHCWSQDISSVNMDNTCPKCHQGQIS